MHAMKQLKFDQSQSVEISFIPETAKLGGRCSDLEGHFICKSCDRLIAWNISVEMYQCIDCEFDMSKEEALDLCLKYRAQLDILIMANSPKALVKPKKSFWRRLKERFTGNGQE